MRVVYFPERIRHIGLFGLPVYEVCVIDEVSGGGVLAHTQTVWGLKNAERVAYAPRQRALWARWVAAEMAVAA